jgi:hypothetical protein
MRDDALPTPRSIPQGYVVSAWCRACQRTVLLDLPALVAGGHGDVPLIQLPLRCRCGSDLFGIIVGAISSGKWARATAEDVRPDVIIPGRVLEMETRPGRPRPAAVD